MLGKITEVFALRKNKSLQASKPHAMGESRLICCMSGGIT
jgi:hypothetical protein